MLQLVAEKTLVRALVYVCINNPPGIGFIGGTLHANQIVHLSHIVPLANTHFFPVTGQMIAEALAKFSFLSLDWIGVFCSDPIDQALLQTLLRETSAGIGIKVFISSTQPHELESPKIDLVPFVSKLTDDVSALTPGVPVEGVSASRPTPAEGISAVPEPEGVSSRLVVHHTHYSNPNINRELHIYLYNQLNLSRLVYTALSFDYTPQRPNSRLLLDSAFDSHLSMDHLVLLSKITVLKTRIIRLMSTLDFDNVDETTDTEKFVKMVQLFLDKRVSKDHQEEGEGKREADYFEALVAKSVPLDVVNASPVQLTFEPPKKAKAGRKKKVPASTVVTLPAPTIVETDKKIKTED